MCKSKLNTNLKRLKQEKSTNRLKKHGYDELIAETSKDSHLKII